MADLIVQNDLELRVGVRTVTELCDDDGDGVADVDVVAWICATASRIAKGALRPGFPSDAQIETLVAADDAVQNDVVEIGVGLMGGRRLSTLGADGRTPYDGWREKAERRLIAIGSGSTRASGEETAGANALLRTRSRSGRRLQFSSSSDDPQGSGGF